MAYTLIITEKPNASKRIAEALTEGRAKKENIKGVPYYRLKHDKKDIIVACAVGHLYGLAEENKSKSFQYPVFETKWVPVYELNKTADYSKKYLDVIKKLAKDADSFIIATDYDIEGEVIGLNCLRFACKKKDAERMKFSALTKPDIIESYNTKSKHLDWGQAEAGETRHKLDWMYGINISRALSSAIKKAGSFKIMSSGRVQGPTLKIIAEREKEIKAFKPLSYWQIELIGDVNAWHEKDKFWDKKEVQKVYQKIEKEKKGTVIKIEKKENSKNPPAAFDLTTLQIESFRCFGISPKKTLEVAQTLYTNGLISYPRTSSQQLPANLKFRHIVKELMKQNKYISLGNKVLQTSLKPANGSKTDPAHPAIYPTGIKPSALGSWGSKIYDLIVKRFFATFGETARREAVHAYINVKEERFIAKGIRTVYSGWFDLYAPYVKLEETELPPLKEEDGIKIKRFHMHEKETQPPKRYTEASIIKELEKRNLGTKATRAHIVDTLVQRNYIFSKPFEVTDLGLYLVEVLEKHSPQIQDEELTRSFEEDMERIRERKKDKESVLDKAKKVLTKILNDFKRNELTIGKGLIETVRQTQKSLNTIGSCPVCKKGTLILRFGKFGRFIACDKYPKCKTTFSLPSGGLLMATDKTCEKCGYPLIDIARKGKKPQRVCINPDCPSKKIKQQKKKRTCPKCGKGTLVVRKSIYGSFLACDQYPGCRYIEKAESKS